MKLLNGLFGGGHRADPDVEAEENDAAAAGEHLLMNGKSRNRRRRRRWAKPLVEKQRVEEDGGDGGEDEEGSKQQKKKEEQNEEEEWANGRGGEEEAEEEEIDDQKDATTATTIVDNNAAAAIPMMRTTTTSIPENENGHDNDGRKRVDGVRSSKDSATALLMMENEKEAEGGGGGGGAAANANKDAIEDIGAGDEFDEEAEESWMQSLKRHARNLLHFFVEDWFISALLGCITAALSISVDVSYELLNHYRAVLFDFAREYDKTVGFFCWVGFFFLFVTTAALVCRYVSQQAIGSGIPEVKVIMNGFSLPNYLSFRTLVAKVLSLTFTLGSGLPVGKEGPFVHMGAIVGHLLSKLTKAWQSSAFFSNEGREVEILSSGCSVGIACTFSSPAGAVLYGIECTHKYFAVKNYWRAFFATTCSALIFRFANAAIIPPHIAGTITAYYQTSFPNEVFLIEEIPVFVFVGLLSGLFGALFVLLHRRITYFKKRNRTFRAIFGRNSLSFTVFMALIVGIVTYPDGFGRFIAGKFTFREILGDFIANCTMSLHNVSSTMGCGGTVIQRWTIADLGQDGPSDRPDHPGLAADKQIFMPNVFPALFGYLFTNFFLVAICITLALPAGIFVPSFVIGACGGRIIGELMVVMFPEGLRGPDGPQIYPGLYAVVGAAAYTGAVTHSLSIAVIVCETTGQLSPLLPVLIALMVANAVSSFLQPSIYESIINIRRYPHLAELPPSRISVHTLMVEQIMVRNVVYITKQTSYKELRELLIATPHLRAYPLVTDDEERILLGSVARKYLHFLLTTHLGPDPSLLLYGSRRRKNRNVLLDGATITTTPNGSSGSGGGEQQKSRMMMMMNANHFFRQNSGINLLASSAAPAAAHKVSLMNERNVFGNTLLSISPLHEDRGFIRSPLAPLLLRQQNHHHSLTATRSNHLLNDKKAIAAARSLRNRSATLRQPIALDEVAIDAAPFQLVIGTSLYKVHTLFALLGLNHAYVTHRGRLVGVVALRELRAALANIYTRGAVRPASSMSRLRLNSQNFSGSGGGGQKGGGDGNGKMPMVGNTNCRPQSNESSAPLTQTTTATMSAVESPTTMDKEEECRHPLLVNRGGGGGVDGGGGSNGASGTGLESRKSTFHVSRVPEEQPAMMTAHQQQHQQQRPELLLMPMPLTTTAHGSLGGTTAVLPSYKSSANSSENKAFQEEVNTFDDPFAPADGMNGHETRKEPDPDEVFNYHNDDGKRRRQSVSWTMEMPMQNETEDEEEEEDDCDD